MFLYKLKRVNQNLIDQACPPLINPLYLEGIILGIPLWVLDILIPRSPQSDSA